MFFSEISTRKNRSDNSHLTLGIHGIPQISKSIALNVISLSHFEKYVFESAAKKVLKLSESYTVISSDKHHGKISLDMLKDGAIGISQLKDNKVRICTQNEEEGLSFIICDVVQHNIVSLRTPKDNQYLEVGIFSGINQIEKNRTAKKNDRNTSQHNGFPVAPQSNDIFSIEVSAD